MTVRISFAARQLKTNESPSSFIVHVSESDDIGKSHTATVQAPVSIVPVDFISLFFLLSISLIVFHPP